MGGTRKQQCFRNDKAVCSVRWRSVTYRLRGKLKFDLFYKWRLANALKVGILWIEIIVPWFWNLDAVWMDGWNACWRQDHGIDDSLPTPPVESEKQP